MTQTRTHSTPPWREPAWDVALLFPPQGEWSEEEYLALETRRPVEFCDGRIEVLEMPTALHQLITAFLYRALFSFVDPRSLGIVLPAAFPVRLREGKYREPDVLFISSANIARLRNEYAEGADLVMEVVSSNRQHDLVRKRHEYALAGIPEYWIVDPERETITVLRLEGDRYAEHGVFARGDTAVSRLLPGFGVSIDDVFDAGKVAGLTS